jgi:hypothetical protein
MLLILAAHDFMGARHLRCSTMFGLVLLGEQCPSCQSIAISAYIPTVKAPAKDAAALL